MRRLFVLLALILIAGEAFGQSTFGTGQWLHDGWLASQKIMDKETHDIADSVQAEGYLDFVYGVAKVMNIVEWLEIPPDVTLGQWLAVVGRYLDDHPEKWNLNAEVLVYRALVVVWPGNKKPAG